MADRYRTNRLVGKRQPLKEVPNQANTPPTSRYAAKYVKSSSPGVLPHNESYEPDGTLKVHGNEASSPHDKRLSHIAEGDGRDSKRNSAISTASTTASGRRRKTYIGHWQLGKTIGKGGCSRVRAVRHKVTKQHGAVKIIGRATAESTRAQSLAHLVDNAKGLATARSSEYRPIPFGLEREIAVMKLLEHENIVRLYDVWENRAELYLIMEYVEGGELFHYVEQRRGLPEDETIYIFRQIVSALLYCHRLNICHRDLKPENILLNSKDMTVKLIDFGMAALQPEGRLLSTPCGSPHYAAPEVVSGKPYDGRQADVWSSGVILYVMLTGTTPFNYSQDGDIRQLFRDISAAHYFMPTEISLESKDMIKRIFVPQPKRRITMDGVWDHALMHKYDKQFSFDGPEGTKEVAIGPIPKLEDWTLKRIQDIDREILRNMRTLWHSESEQGLIQKLLNKELNQEKLFYAALLKHQEENLENYCGDAEDVTYSASDYHHSKPPNMAQAPPMPPSSQQRSQSTYSIMNDEHLRPSHSFVEPPPSVSSYDPYRASRDPIVNGHGEYLNVVVHRNGTNASRKSGPQRSLRHPGPLRVEMLKNGSKRSSQGSPSSSSLARAGRSRSSMRRSSTSRHSMTSSVWPSSPPVIATMRPSDLHKRNVSFNHVRHSSTASGLASQDGSAPTSSTTASSPQTKRQRQVIRPANPAVPSSSSPAAPPSQVLRSRKEKTTGPHTPKSKAHKAETPGQHMRSEIRKHSAELEKACEEAFFRASVGSSTTAHSNFTDKPSPYETPPSSVSALDVKVTPEIPQCTPGPRPLPSLPQDTPNSYLTRTLEETREKLAAFQSTGDDENAAKFDEVLRMLENIMPASRAPEKRTVSAPGSRMPENTGGLLPIISEEISEHRMSKDAAANWYRSVTSPVPYTKRPEERTVRIVPPASPGTPAPLNVRKRSNGSGSSEDDQQRAGLRKPVDKSEHKRGAGMDQTLESIEEDPAVQTSTVIRKTKSGWFGLKKHVATPQPEKQGCAEPALKSRTRTSNVPPPSATSSEFPPREAEKKLAAKRGLAKWFNRKKHIGDEGGAVDTSFANTSFDSLFSTRSPTPSWNNAPAASIAERSWFARFLHIKPAVRILCFNIARHKLRSELVILLKEWQRHGIRDITYSRETNTITARVDKYNSLDIKPVTFRIELFVVLEHGKKVGMSIARFVQVKGAISGFRKVLEVVDGVMRSRGWLIDDEEKWRALSEIVGG